MTEEGRGVDPWEDVRRKIQELEKDPFLGTDMVKTLDTLSIADYWRRRYEEERALWAQKLAGREEESGQLKARLERQGLELQMAREQLEAARSALLDKERYWEEKVRALELENRGLRDRADWEVRWRTLEAQNRLLAEQLERPRPAAEDPAAAAARERAARDIQELRAGLTELLEEKRRGDEERGRLRSRAEESALGRKESEARERERLRETEDLARGFAHRVRNQLGILSGALQLALADPKLDEGTAAQLRLAEETSREMLSAVEEYVSLARVPQFLPETLSLNDFLKKTVAFLEDKLREGRASVRWSLAEGLPPVRADARLLEEAVRALAFNAVEAMPGGGELEVSTAFDPVARAVTARFRDKGPGIPEHQLSKVFQPYFSTKKGRKGLGLPLCRRVMGLFRGSLRLEAPEGGGTAVALTFPAAGE